MRAIPAFLRRRAVLITLGVLGAAGLAVGARAVTASLLGTDATQPGGEVAVVTSTTTTTSSSTEDREPAPSTTLSTSPTTLSTTSTTQVPPEDPVADGVTAGEPIITPRQPVAFRDRVTVLPTVVADLPSFPTQTPTEGTPSSGSGPVSTPDVTNGEVAPLPRAFNLGVTVEPENQFAVIRVGVDAGPEGLSELSIAFGDGDVRDVSPDEIARLGDVGTIEVIHRYEPTLTPQPQEVTATATDGAGTVKVASARFETQAAFLLSYSPLTLTALDDCDQFGKGDFELYWNNDGRDRHSSFDLGKGDSHIERRFRVGLPPIRYGEPAPLSMGIEEKDPVAIALLRFAWADYNDLGNLPFDLAVEVMKFGTHTIPISLEHEVRDDCDMRIDFSVTLGLSERSPR